MAGVLGGPLAAWVGRVPRRFGWVPRPSVVLGLLIGVTTLSGGAPRLARAQDLVATSRPRISSPRDLETALRAASRPGRDELIETALIATWGEPVTTWALELAREETQPDYVRDKALKVLSYTRPRYAISILTVLSRPETESDIWVHAMGALQMFPYPELAPFWRSLLNYPSPSVRLMAMFGLSMTGTAADTALIAAVDRARPTELGALAIARLRQPPEARDTIVFGRPPTAEARFVPSQSWLARARAYLCATRGGC